MDDAVTPIHLSYAPVTSEKPELDENGDPGRPLELSKWSSPSSRLVQVSLSLGMPYERSREGRK